MNRATVLLLGAVLLACTKNPPKDAPGDGRAQTEPAATAPAATPAPAEGPSAGGAPCGSATCKAGEYCCNPSCSICAPDGGFCTQQFCEADAAGPSAGGEPSPTGGACASDADCRTFSSYCNETPCLCFALAKGQPDPTCKGPSSVRCLADPCMNKVARCVSGACVVAAK